MKKSDLRKQGIAWRIRAQTTVSTRWIAERLLMGNPTSVSQAVKGFREAKRVQVRRIKKKLAKGSELRD